MRYYSGYYILIPALLLSIWAQIKVKTTFSKYSVVLNRNGYTGAQVARMLLDSNGYFYINVEVIPGELTDHYDPTNRVIRLSEEVFYGTSVASIGVAAHETGHAMQHQQNYRPLIFRNSIVPAVNISSNLSWILFLLGIMFSRHSLVNIGILLFSAVVLFQLVTLPVELNASHRALVILREKRILYDDEIGKARSVLTAAAMTYIAAAVMAISQLIRLYSISREE